MNCVSHLKYNHGYQLNIVGASFCNKVLHCPEILDPTAGEVKSLESLLHLHTPIPHL